MEAGRGRRGQTVGPCGPTAAVPLPWFREVVPYEARWALDRITGATTAAATDPMAHARNTCR